MKEPPASGGQPVTAGPNGNLACWQEAFDNLMGRVVGRFARVEPRRRMRKLMLGLLSDPPRKNCWTIAEWVGDTTPDGMQHLLGRAKWDADQVRDDVRIELARAEDSPPPSRARLGRPGRPGLNHRPTASPPSADAGLPGGR